MKIVDEIKNKEKLFNALPVSIKYEWRWNDAAYALHKEHNGYLGAQNIEDQFTVN